ncbi:MAG: sigma-70 family RNA polymerase sigma factor [Pseudomonadota bacterium]
MNKKISTASIVKELKSTSNQDSVFEGGEEAQNASLEQATVSRNTQVPSVPNSEDMVPPALISLFQTYSGELTGYLRKHYGDGPPDPEDVAQDAFTKLIQLDDISTIKNLRAFLWRTARNLMISGKRHLSVRTKYDYEVEKFFFAVEGIENSPENVIEANQQLSLINHVIATMPENRRKAFLLHRVEGLNFSETGRRLGMTPSAVIKNVGRAVLDIKNALKETMK